MSMQSWCFLFYVFFPHVDWTSTDLAGFFRGIEAFFFSKKIIIEDYDKAINKGFNKFQKCNMISLVWILIQKWKSENINAIVILNKWKWKKLTWRGMWPTMVTHILNLCSAINPSKVHTHSSEHTHTYREHTPGEVDSHLCCGARGAVRVPWGALLMGTSVVVLRVERVLYIHSPHLQFLQDLRLELATFRPWLPLKWIDVEPKISYHWPLNSVGDLQWPNISGKKLREAILVHHLLTYILYKGSSLCKYHHLGPLNNSTTLSALHWLGNWTALIYSTRIHEPILHSSYRPWLKWSASIRSC